MKRTPMYECHVAAGGRMVDFGGWELPVQYEATGIKTEHLNVRSKAGLFDVSHMGEVTVVGPRAEAWISGLVTNDVTEMHDGQVQYNIMCTPTGGVVDDLLVYRYTRERYLLVINAANVEKDWAWFNDHLTDGVKIENISMQTAEVALQGPNAEAILRKIVDFDPAALEFFHFKDPVDVGGIKAIVSRTGYTGEDGFEIYVDWSKGAELWNIVMEAGKDLGLMPIGLGARDSLRFEAGLPLCGQEFTDTLGPLEAGFGFFVKVDKAGGFIGQPVLKQQKADGLKRKIVAAKLIDKGVPRHEMEVADKDGNVIGVVTTGGYGPSLDANLANCLVNVPAPAVGENLWIVIRGKAKKAEVVKKPFYKKSYKK
ncbi:MULTISPECIES: glycine cleavage system aminomethyltransferase GcvT [unclassified Pyramidobacter]|uniref:glycine cleavage system aminomethyltransferase GcvT n=1 Tax=unclassified Pyramidobacter TaxID=2632171 RepID=UPI000EA0E2B4|nr:MULTISPECIES: glycine cleavage system aminomethyltransferase GcvT [unclassified Pyramidobacter]MCI7403005.1 glycine cleavage system aminomethyltransferase GcvT [Pyramidobacter sp.]MDY3213263.1 glycine cleavage system aminomethyltransferase GcvT [Pyramidobacter sp.]RKJ79264.1 glycine cleavage system aminomethyltransferase GcvT [Pyramidobacter sp. CG50-2]WOL40442.1 glycine cleavage system aminomethyltransferase GcvT [Pyramidobacter sp. YE332]